MGMDVEKKIEKSKEVVKEAFDKYGKNMVIAWTGGKDSMTVLGLVKEALEGVPLPVLFIEESHFEEIYEFKKRIEKEWDLNIITVGDEESLRKYHETDSMEEKKKLARELKINALKKAFREHNWHALISGIRWDEQEARSNETFFSERGDHMRVHPILHWTEDDVWSFIKSRNIPYNPLYDKGYRSLGEKEFTQPGGDSERAGREQDKEKIMEKLRKLGYF